MLSIDDFQAITLDTKPLFDAFFKKYPPIHSDYVFVTMTSWNEYAHYEYLFIEDTLLVKTTVQGKTYFRPPLGKCNKEVLDQLLSLSHSEGSDYLLSMVTSDRKEWIEKYYHQFSFIPLPEYADYVYRSTNLSQLKGSGYRKIRNRLNKFVKNISYETEHISEGILTDVKHFLKRWCVWKECEDDPLLKYEKKAVMYSVENFMELGLSGIVIRVNDRIEALSFYEPMNPSTVVVHFEKGSPYFDGIYKLVNQATARSVETSYTFINRESDMGNPGLRKAKRSYRPDHMVPVYNIKKKDEIL